MRVIDVTQACTLCIISSLPEIDWGPARSIYLQPHCIVPDTSQSNALLTDNTSSRCVTLQKWTVAIVQGLIVQRSGSGLSQPGPEARLEPGAEVLQAVVQGDARAPPGRLLGPALLLRVHACPALL